MTLGGLWCAGARCWRTAGARGGRAARARGAFGARVRGVDAVLAVLEQHSYNEVD
ncbi:MAG: hypothetical protein ACRENP_21630 [Longimicrobiales bacterium]